MLLASSSGLGHLVFWSLTGCGAFLMAWAVFIYVHPLRRPPLQYLPACTAVLGVSFLVPGIAGLVWRSNATAAKVWVPVEVLVVVALFVLVGLQLWSSLPRRNDS